MTHLVACVFEKTQREYTSIIKFLAVAASLCMLYGFLAPLLAARRRRATMPVQRVWTKLVSTSRVIEPPVLLLASRAIRLDAAQTDRASIVRSRQDVLRQPQVHLSLRMEPGLKSISAPLDQSRRRRCLADVLKRQAIDHGLTVNSNENTPARAPQ